MLDVARTMLEVAVLAAALWLFVFQVSVVSGHSMDPSLEPGDRLVIDKLSGVLGEPKRFDVVVFECPGPTGDSGMDYVKRIVGLADETVELRSGKLYVDGELVDQDFKLTSDETMVLDPVGVPSGCVYVLGDNRPRSRDSRDFGAVPLGSIKGVARFRVYPFGRAGFL